MDRDNRNYNDELYTDNCDSKCHDCNCDCEFGRHCHGDCGEAIHDILEGIRDIRKGLECIIEKKSRDGVAEAVHGIGCIERGLREAFKRLDKRRDFCSDRNRDLMEDGIDDILEGVEDVCEGLNEVMCCRRHDGIHDIKKGLRDIEEGLGEIIKSCKERRCNC